MCSLALFAALLTAQGLQQTTFQSRRSLPRAAASDDADALLAAAASLRAEASQLEKEIAPPVAPPPPPPPRPEVVAGVDARELVPWTGTCFAAKIELDQFDEAGDAGGVATRSTPAEWQPWFEPGASVPLPMGVILEEGGGGAIVVAEVVEGSAGERADVRVGDVLRACSAVTRGIRYGGAAAPEAGSALGRRPAEPFEISRLRDDRARSGVPRPGA
ncbi:tRNA-Phe hydroxylase [Aureococcus anophagefferens]|nr:tRNA-Phe hydroxylase [Aureococcus anophagefferens]